MAVIIAFSGYFYSTTSLDYSNSDMRGMFGGLVSVLLFVIPVITMKLFSEEKKNRTEYGFLSLPVNAYEVVIGKFMAALVMFILSLSGTMLYVVFTMMFGELQIMMVLGNYLALILLAAVLISIGLFISSFTENQIVCAVLSFFILYASYSFGQVLPSIKNPITSKLLSFFAIFSHHDEFTYGVFGFANIFYYVSLTALFIFLTTIIIEKRRYD